MTPPTTTDPEAPDATEPTTSGPRRAGSGPVTGRVVRAGGLSLRLAPRTLTVAVVVAVLLAAVMIVTLTAGEYSLTLGQVLASLAGRGDETGDFVVYTLMLPRLLVAVLVGAMLAVSGGILQTVTRNSLGSPDVIGFTSAAATGALVVITVLGGTMLQVSLGALVGGIVAALLIYVLAYHRGVSGLRFVLMGIGINALAVAANSFLITRASLHDALTAQAWLVGSVNSRGWEHVVAAAVTLAVLLPVALSRTRSLSMMELGDDTASALGVRTGRDRTVLIGVSVLLAAFAVAAAGPITFVALAAPQLTRRLTRASAPGLVTTALVGALLLATGDLLVQQLFPAAQLPVGTATGCVGGLYLIWLLASEWRGKGRYA
ncbi:iron complex transport system permease protein [Prauserella aidingensis]|uniref:FecCD family ABC transporter permease n=1 Tax=Prauserella aidingensis TaxID=387890 RepID=UPI003558DBB8|nr:iron complex transport system permease protein [Prauserella aidingensis]